MTAKIKCKLNCGCKLNTDPFQWWIQRRAGGGRAPLPPIPLFLDQIEAQMAKKIFLGRPDPPPTLI